jgi:ASC-1-like (ASCH) protein
MEHIMNLQPEPMKMIRNGQKECGYTKDNIKSANEHDMEQYYSKEQQAKYGVVGIKISVL